MICQISYDRCGDINGDGEWRTDIGDLVYLVNYMFNGGPQPPTLWTANIDGAAYQTGINHDITIGDLVYLVNYMFNGGPAPLCADIPEGNKASTGGMTYEEAINMINNAAGKKVF